MAEPNPDRIVVACPCGAKLRVAATSVGKRARCPKCGEAFKIEAPSEPKPSAPTVSPSAPTATPSAPTVRPAAPAAPAPLAFDDGDDLLGELAAQEQHAAATPTGRPCPKCQALLAPRDAVCMNCGFDVKQGRGRSTALLTDDTAEDGQSEIRYPGSFARGCLYSAIGATLGAIAWCIIVYSTDYEFGIVAWGIGLLAGVGMAIGNKLVSDNVSLVAAAIALGGVLLGKALVIAVVMHVHLPDDSAFYDTRRDIVIQKLALEALDGKTEDPTEEAWAEAIDAATAQVEPLSPEEITERWEAYRGEFDQAWSAGTRHKNESHPYYDYTIPIDAGDGVDLGATFTYHFKASFGRYDFLWLGLAVFTAYRIAGRAAGD